ncbi:retrovirus-related pol polyprotein from transposon TNT 1-94 [Tanacetum coccineum]
MLSASKLPLFFWAEAIATTCYTQNRSIIIPTHEKTAYHIINDRKSLIKHLYIFGCTCYLTRDGENLDKIKEKGDPCILVGYSTQSKGYRVYNKRTRLIVESIHLRFDEIKEMSETSVANDTPGLVPQQQKASDYDNPDPAPELQNVSSSTDTTVPSQQELDLLFGPLYDEFFNVEPTTPTNLHAEENNDNQSELTNPFCTLGKLLHQFDRTPSSGNSLDNTLWARNVIKLSGYGKTIRMKTKFVIRTKDTVIVANRLCSGKRFEMSLMREMKFFLGLQIYQSRGTLSIRASMLEILKKSGLVTINWGLWYSKDSGFELTAFSDDPTNVRLVDTRKSTYGGIQFYLGE